MGGTDTIRKSICLLSVRSGTADGPGASGGQTFQGTAFCYGNSGKRSLSGAGRRRAYSGTGGYRRLFEEDDGVVLVDYKTDHVPLGKAGETMLIQRYKTQMDYYQRAIEQISGKKVKDRILYSVIMDREIHC